MCFDGLFLIKDLKFISGTFQCRSERSGKETNLFVLVRCTAVENDLMIISCSRRSEGSLVSDRDSIDNLYVRRVVVLLRPLEHITDLGMTHDLSRG